MKDDVILPPIEWPIHITGRSPTPACLSCSSNSKARFPKDRLRKRQAWVVEKTPNHSHVMKNEVSGLLLGLVRTWSYPFVQIWFVTNREYSYVYQIMRKPVLLRQKLLHGIMYNLCKVYGFKTFGQQKVLSVQRSVQWSQSGSLGSLSSVLGGVSWPSGTLKRWWNHFTAGELVSCTLGFKPCFQVRKGPPINPCTNTKSADFFPLR